MLIFWILNNGNIIQDNDRFMLRHGNRSLVINNVEEEDEGYYFCVAKLGLIWSKRNSIFFNVT
ncbi:neurofascin, partial [Biomphalaria glabrata]